MRKLDRLGGVKVNTPEPFAYDRLPPPLADATVTDRFVSSILSELRLVKFASTSLLVRGLPFPDLVVIVAMS